jgi:hypothetical protein
MSKQTQNKKRVGPYSQGHHYRLARNFAKEVDAEAKRDAQAIMAAKFPELYGKIYFTKLNL